MDDCKYCHAPLGEKGCEACRAASVSFSPEFTGSIARFKEIKNELGDCDFMRVFLNGWTVDAVVWMMAELEKLYQAKQ